MDESTNVIYYHSNRLTKQNKEYYTNAKYSKHTFKYSQQITGVLLEHYQNIMRTSPKHQNIIKTSTVHHQNATNTSFNNTTITTLKYHYDITKSSLKHIWSITRTH